MIPALIPLVGGCTQVNLDEPSVSTDAIDVRNDFPAPPEGGVQYISPEYIIEAFTEKQYCYFLTYEGPDTAITHQGVYQSDHGHHVLMLTTTLDDFDFPDHEYWDCTEDGDLAMVDTFPLFVGSVDENGNFGVSDGAGALTLPEGMGTRLNSGTRLVMQSHYVNPLSSPILVQDAVNFGVMPQEDVEVWTAPAIHIVTDHPLEMGVASSLTFDCTWSQDASLLFLNGHMHELGTSFSTDHTHAGGTDRVYDVPVWDVSMRDAPPTVVFDVAAPLSVQEGDVFTTTCNWFNDRDHVVDFPEEMCTTVAMAYPTKIPLMPSCTRR